MPQSGRCFVLSTSEGISAASGSYMIIYYILIHKPAQACPGEPPAGMTWLKYEEPVISIISQSDPIVYLTLKVALDYGKIYIGLQGTYWRMGTQRGDTSTIQSQAVAAARR